jgi:hypothetical protein
MRMGISSRRAETEMVFRCRRRSVVIVEVGQIAVKFRRDIAGQFALLDLILIRVNRLAFDLKPAFSVDGMGDIGVEFEARPAMHSALHLHAAVFVEALAAVVAEAGAEVIFLSASAAAIAQLATGHRQEKSVISFDDFHIADDEGVVEGQRAKCF